MCVSVCLSVSVCAVCVGVSVSVCVSGNCVHQKINTWASNFGST